jgi:predicted DNA-binding transcriptional regulator AlpA
MKSVNKIILVGNLGREPGFSSYLLDPYVHVRSSWRHRCAGGLSVSSDVPECGGGGASAATAAPAGTDDGGGSDGDGTGDSDPEPERQRSPQHPTPPSLLPLPAVSRRASLGASRIYALIAEGQFPPPVKVGRSSRWVEAEVDAWIASLIQARATSAAR